MKLFTKALLKDLPALYSTEQVPNKDKVIYCKFFDPCGSYTFYCLEGDVEEDGDVRLFGFVTGLGCDEFGYVMLSEIQSYKGLFGLGIELDKYFKPTLLKDIPGVFEYLNES